MTEDIREIKQDLKELIKQGAEHNVLLKTHEARSLALQQEQKLQASKMEPISRHVELMNVLLKAAGAVAIFIAGQGLLRLFF